MLTEAACRLACHIKAEFPPRLDAKERMAAGINATSKNGTSDITRIGKQDKVNRAGFGTMDHAGSGAKPI